jgi:hypothetical protein
MKNDYICTMKTIILHIERQEQPLYYRGGIGV